MKKKNIRNLGFLLLVLLVVGGLFYAFSMPFGADANQEIVVSREREYVVERGNLIAGIDGVGKLSMQRVSQRFGYEAKILEMYVEVGQRIEKGDLIAKPAWGKPMVATVSGVVVEVNAQKGDVVGAQSDLITIADQKAVNVELSISQENVLDLEKGQTVYVWVSAHPGVTFKGVIDFINFIPRSEGNGTQFGVKVKLDAAGYELLDGMGVSAQFIIKEKKDILLLSNKAILIKDNKQFVRIKNEFNEIQEIEIETGFSDGKKSEILAGVKEGDKVIVGGQ